ncbi:hypothetical protein [Alteraurantiacibacter aestuarii]|uniref:hypothetical protein n=1 Tax=Alteraurantiacibacter aestuarii TaxID=650004 RepID=UPI0031CFF874
MALNWAVSGAMSRAMNIRKRWLTVIAPLAVLLSAQPALADDLPDWSGVWELVGGTVYDRPTMVPEGARAGDPGAREHPPYNEEWEAKYQRNIALVVQDRFPDPVTTCGTPVGFPRVMQVVDGYEFVVTPGQTWILTENGPNVVRIYTDGRDHMDADVIWPTYTGDSVGHWEGDTLVFTTIGLRGEDGTIVDRTGLILSDQAHGTTRLRKREDGMMEAVITMEDPAALTAPWTVTKTYRKFEGDARIMDYACAENNRNPVDPDTGRTLTLGADGEPIDTGYAAD